MFLGHHDYATATSDGLYTRIRSHNNFLSYSHVAHDCIVGNHVIFSNNGTLAGRILWWKTFRDSWRAGGDSSKLQSWHDVDCGGCAKVVQDVPPYMIADELPAETRGINKVGMERNRVPEEAQRSLRRPLKYCVERG